MACFIPCSPPTAFKMRGRRRKEKMMVRIPWMKSVTMAAPRPPATPYMTNIIVIMAMARFAESMPCVLAEMTSEEPLSITPVVTIRLKVPTRA